MTLCSPTAGRRVGTWCLLPGSGLVLALIFAMSTWPTAARAQPGPENRDPSAAERSDAQPRPGGPSGTQSSAADPSDTQSKTADPSNTQSDPIGPSGTRRSPAGPSNPSIPQVALAPGPSLTLDEALTMADQRNFSLAAARQDIATARASLKASWATLIPSASASLSFTHNDHADTVDMQGMSIETRKQQSLSGTVQVNIPLINAQSWVAVGLSRLDVEINRLTVQSTRQALLLSVSQAYMQALTAKQLIAVQQALYDSTRRHLLVAEMRHRSGTGARVDVLRTHTELVGIEEEMVKAQISLENARQALGVLLGREDLPRPVPQELEPPDVPAEKELLDLAMRQREDLRLSQKMVRVSEKQKTLSWMQFLPSLNAMWQLSYQISEPSSFGSQDQSRWLLGLTLSVPLFDEGRYADLDQARAAISKAKLQAQQSALSATAEVKQNRRNYLQAVSLARTAETKADLAAETLELAEAAYRAGTGTSLSVTDAQRSSRTAQIDLATKRLSAMVSWLSLWRSVGHDMQRLGAASSPAQPRKN